MAIVYQFRPPVDPSSLQVGQIVLTRDRLPAIVLSVDGQDVETVESTDRCGLSGFALYNGRGNILRTAIYNASANGLVFRWRRARDLSLPWIFGQ